jgi:hypothetical protein
MGFRRIGAVKDEYAVSKDGMKPFWGPGPRHRHARLPVSHRHPEQPRQKHAPGHDRGLPRVRLRKHGLPRDFQPVLAKHSKNFSLTAALSTGVDEMQRNFGGMRTQVEAWRESQISDVAAKLIINRAFIESDLEVPKHLAKPVHEMYFNPQHEEFQPRTMWSLSNAFTSAFKELEPIPQFRATAKLGGFLTAAEAS